ncbi:MAG: glycosyltransferase family 4 protein [Dehalococcoidia bacterium]|nr:glycosyltransferase family 4 protein [Dehalococcoidia bacterium]
MNILLVVPYFGPMMGGAKYVLHVANGLADRGHSVTVFSTDCDADAPFEVNKGIRVIRKPVHFTVSGTPVRLTLIYDLHRLTRESHFDLINAHTPVPFYADVAAVVAKLRGIPFVLTYHNDTVSEKFLLNAIVNAYNHSFNLLTLNFSNLIITPSPFCLNESKWLSKHSDRVVWIPPGVDNKRFVPHGLGKLDISNIPSHAKVVTFVGKMSEAHAHKGINYLLDAFKKVVSEIGDSYLILIGSCDILPEIEHRCRELDIADHVRIPGWITEDQLVAYYQGSDVVVLPTINISEGFGMVLTEANSCGTPVVGSRVGGIQYVIKHEETGLLVPPKDSDALAEAIIRLLRNDELARRLGENGARMVRDQYDWESIVDKTETVFDSAVRDRGRGCSN